MLTNNMKLIGLRVRKAVIRSEKSQNKISSSSNVEKGILLEF